MRIRSNFMLVSITPNPGVPFAFEIGTPLAHFTPAPRPHHALPPTHRPEQRAGTPNTPACRTQAQDRGGA